MNLGRIERVELRNIWKNEAYDFTPWLASDENIHILSETIGLDLEVHSQEKSVGPYSADILCKDESSDSWVLIENQLEKTDHTHLGQLLTYAAGLDAAVIIWIAARITDEHKAALDWLNEITDQNFSFFGLEIEVWKIGNSDPAPKFNIVSRPNDWAKSLKSNRKNNQSEITATKKKQLEYWTKFKEFMEAENSIINCRKPLPQHWFNHPVGKTGMKLSSVATTWNSEKNTYNSGEIRAEFVVRDSMTNFEIFEENKDDINESFQSKLIWSNRENKKSAKIYLRKEADIMNENDWVNQHIWLKENLEKLYIIFNPYVKQIRKR